MKRITLLVILLVLITGLNVMSTERPLRQPVHPLIDNDISAMQPPARSAGIHWILSDEARLPQKMPKAFPFETSDPPIQYSPPRVLNATGGTATTLTVPAPYATIQSAIDAASSGDTITVGAGSYPEAILIDGKNLVIQGAGTGSSIITGSASVTEYIVKITNSAVVDISGFTIDGTGKNVQYGVYATAYTDGNIHDNEIKNVVYPGAAGMGVRRLDSYIDVKDNDVYGFGRIGIYTRDETIGNTDTGVISGNTVTGLDGSDPDRISYGISCYYGNPTMDNNHVYDCRSGANQTGWLSSGFDIWNGATPAVTNNDVHDSQYGIVVLNCSPTLSGNTFDTIDAEDIRIDLIVKGNPTSHWGEWYDTIQDALDAVPATTYDVLVWIAVYSGGGTYVEDLTVTKPCYIIGYSPATTIIKPATTTPFDPVGNTGATVMNVTADSVYCFDFTIDGTVSGTYPLNRAKRGLYYLSNTNGWIENVHVGNCISSIVGVLCTDMAVNDCVVDSFAYDLNMGGGIYYWGTSGDIGTYAGNTVSNGLGTGIIYHNSSSGTASGNTVTNSELGILVNGNNLAAVVTDNTVTGCDMGIQTVSCDAAAEVSKNTITDCNYGYMDYGSDIADSVQVFENTILGGGGGGGAGIFLSDDLDPWGQSDSRTKIYRNTVSGFADGVVFEETVASLAYNIYCGIGNGSGMTNYFYSFDDYVMRMDGCDNDVSATHNYLGTDDPEAALWHQPDDAALGLITYSDYVSAQITIDPDYDVTNCSTGKTFVFRYDGTGIPQEVRGYDITFSVDTGVAAVNNVGTDIAELTFLSGVGITQFFALNKGGGEYTVSCAILGGSAGATGAGDLFSVLLTPVAEGTTSITITQVKIRDVDNQPMPGDASGADLQVDCTYPTMEAIAESEGDCYNTAPDFSNFGFDDDVNLDFAEYQIDAGGWVSLFSGIDATEWNDDGWTLPGFSGLSEGSHTVYFRVQDDAGNMNGEGGAQPDTYSWQFIKDTTAPDRPTDVTATPGHNKVHLTWTNPTGDSSFEGVEIRRIGWRDYPQFASTAPSYPANETEGILVTQINAEAYDDSVQPRDIYYYSVFSYDCAGNYSSYDVDVSGRATSYWLGDIDSTGYVNGADLVTFSGTFGTYDGGPGFIPESDFGPSDDYSRFGIPLPDDFIDFEDLMIFAMNYGNVMPSGVSPAVPVNLDEELSDLVVFRLVPVEADESGSVTGYAVVVENSATSLKGFRLVIDYGFGNELVGIERGSMVGANTGNFFGTITGEQGKADISVAALGVDRPFRSTGEVAKIFVREGMDLPQQMRIEKIDLRNVKNEKDQIENSKPAETPFIPMISALMQNHPNPFNPATTITYDVASSGQVSIQIFDVTGRLVRTLVNAYRTAGRYQAEWDGTNENGTQVHTGMYFYRMKAPDFISPAKKMILLK